MSDETAVYTFFDSDGPIRLTETELCNAYMAQRRFAAEETERAIAAEAERDEAHARVRLYLTEVEIVNMRAEAAEARVAELKAALAGRDDALERTASLACYLLNALQPWGLQSPEVRSAATRLTVSLAALTPPSEAAAALAKGDTA